MVVTKFMLIHISVDRNKLLCLWLQRVQVHTTPYLLLSLCTNSNGTLVSETSFQPSIGFKTRYGMVSNPFGDSTKDGDGVIDAMVTITTEWSE